MLQQIRAQLPAETLLFWLCPPDAADAAALLQQAADGRAERTIAGVANEDWGTEGKLETVIYRLAQRSVRLIVHHGFEQRYPQECEWIQHCIQRALFNCSMDAGRGLIFFRSSLLNLGYMVERSVCGLPKIAHGTDAVLCAAGPSLCHQLDALKAIQHRVVIVAVGHALATLLKAGIHPHIVVEDDSCAGGHWPEELTWDELLLVAATTLDPQVARRFERILWCRGSSMPFNELMDAQQIKFENMTLFHTISTHAMDVLIRMGCRRIALVGQDLCLGPAGLLHADAKRTVAEVDAFAEVPGNHGGLVKTTKDLSVLRQSVEDYLQLLKRKLAGASWMPKLINCTDGGAVIAGVPWCSFEDFCADIADAPVHLNQPERKGAGQLQEGINALIVTLERYRQLLGQVLAATRSLEREVRYYPANPGALKQMQQQLQEALQAEQRFVNELDEANRWQSLLARFADRVGMETPAFQCELDPAGQLNKLYRHYRLLHDLTQEFLGDVHAAHAVVVTGAPIQRSPLVFTAFRDQAVLCLRNTNPGLADWLAGLAGPPEVDSRFRFRWKYQFLAVMDVRENDQESFVPVAAEWTLFEAAGRDVEAQINRYGLKASSLALVIVAPCSWVHVVEWVKRFPDVPLLIIEPWLDVLAAQVFHGCFLHVLPASALVLGTKYAFQDWQNMTGDWLDGQQKAGRSLHYFSPPCVAEWREIKQLTAQLKELSGKDV